MIIDNFGTVVSPIALSVLLIAYLMIVELGNPKIKKLLIPIIIALMIIFSIIAVQDVMSKW